MQLAGAQAAELGRDPRRRRCARPRAGPAPSASSTAALAAAIVAPQPDASKPAARTRSPSTATEIRTRSPHAAPPAAPSKRARDRRGRGRAGAAGGPRSARRASASSLERRRDRRSGVRTPEDRAARGARAPAQAPGSPRWSPCRATSRRCELCGRAWRGRARCACSRSSNRSRRTSSWPASRSRRHGRGGDRAAPGVLVDVCSSTPGAPVVLLEDPRHLGNLGACVRVAAAARGRVRTPSTRRRRGAAGRTSRA